MSKERVWFSPHCLTGGSLFDAIRETETEACDREIAAAEAYLRASGVEEMEGALMGLRDWRTEKRLIEHEEALAQQGKK